MPEHELGTLATLGGRWVRPATYAALIDVSVQHLANMRLEDRKAGRILPNHPVWRVFGDGAVRYWLDSSFAPASDRTIVGRPRRMEAGNAERG